MTAVAVIALAGDMSAVTKKKKAAPGKNTASHTTASSRKSSTTRRKGRTRTAASRRGTYRQLAPTPDRYKEIQKALADRGYLKTEPNGVWDSNSQQAMRAFQSDQKLDPTGKLTAASLIGLGLGPKHDASPNAAASANSLAPSAPGASATPIPTALPARDSVSPEK